MVPELAVTLASAVVTLVSWRVFILVMRIDRLFDKQNATAKK